MAVAPTSELVGRPSPAAPAAMAPARRRPALSWQSAAAGVVLAFPFVFLAAFALYPLLQQAIGSLFRWYDLRPSAFAGLSDYSQALRDPRGRLGRPAQPGLRRPGPAGHRRPGLGRKTVVITMFFDPSVKIRPRVSLGALPPTGSPAHRPTGPPTLRPSGPPAARLSGCPRRSGSRWPLGCSEGGSAACAVAREGAGRGQHSLDRARSGPPWGTTLSLCRVNPT